MLERVPVAVLASRIIPAVDPALAARLQLKPEHASLALFTTDCDDVGYTAVDEATKKAAVDVVYAASFYAGASHSSGPFSGEFIGILAAPGPADARAGLDAAVDFALNDAAFVRAPRNPDLTFYAHLVSACGTYFADQAGIAPGTSMAYLIAPPLEATFGLDAALKAASVGMVNYFPPPSETNFSGAWLSGDQAACRAACDAFRDAVLSVAERPRQR